MRERKGVNGVERKMGRISEELRKVKPEPEYIVYKTFIHFL